MKLRKDFKTSNNPPAGSVGYLIGKAWVLNYKQYIQYKSLKARKQFDPTKYVAHPGKISNQDFLNTNHLEFLQGSKSNTEKG